MSWNVFKRSRNSLKMCGMSRKVLVCSKRSREIYLDLERSSNAWNVFELSRSVKQGDYTHEQQRFYPSVNSLRNLHPVQNKWEFFLQMFNHSIKRMIKIEKLVIIMTIIPGGAKKSIRVWFRTAKKL
jgi:hypothetical protein